MKRPTCPEFNDEHLNKHQELSQKPVKIFYSFAFLSNKTKNSSSSHRIAEHLGRSEMNTATTISIKCRLQVNNHSSFYKFIY